MGPHTFRPVFRRTAQGKFVVCTQCDGGTITGHWYYSGLLAIRGLALEYEAGMKSNFLVHANERIIQRWRTCNDVGEYIRRVRRDDVLRTFAFSAQSRLCWEV